MYPHIRSYDDTCHDIDYIYNRLKHVSVCIDLFRLWLDKAWSKTCQHLIEYIKEFINVYGSHLVEWSKTIEAKTSYLFEWGEELAT